MSGGEAVVLVAGVVVAAIGGALACALVLVSRSLRALRTTLADFSHESAALVDELRAEARHAAAEVDRVDRLVRSAETLEERADAASRLAYRTLSSPVVKAMALGSGVSQASRRLRGAGVRDDARRDPRRERPVRRGRG